MGKDNSKKLIFIVLLIGMVIFYGLNFYKTANTIKNCTEVTTAKITEVEKRTKERNDKENTYYYPTVTYSVGEMQFTETSRDGSSSSLTYKVGDVIEIKYNPSHPSEFIINKNGISPMLTQIIIPIIVILLIALYIAYKMIQNKRK